jgi:hypothetical protein
MGWSVRDSRGRQSHNRAGRVPPIIGIRESDVVALGEPENGTLISSQEVLAMDTLDPLGKVLRQLGIPLEELMESGREIRGKMVDDDRGSIWGASGQRQRSTQRRQ